jgi:hypothetical protein
MSLKPYYTSTDLIEAVGRKAAVPFSQNTFTETDVLRFANEEMFLAQVPNILQFHEEYLVYEQEVSLISNVSRYAIPNRAIGMKFRDVFYKDPQGNLVEMSKISPDDRSFFQTVNDSGSVPYHYYLQNNSLIVTPTVGANPQGSLVFTYFLRPNSLVLNERAAICQSFSKNLVLTANLDIGDSILIGALTLIADTDFVIGLNEAATANNIVSAINTDSRYAASSNSNVVTVTYTTVDVPVSAVSAFITVQSTITVNFDQVPTNITNSSLVDLLQTEGGHSTLKFDVRLGANSVSGTTITFNTEDVPEDFIVGDYVCSQYECIIPQVPSDLHNLLAERTCARILESLGDQEGLKSVNAKIAEQTIATSNIMDSRVDGSPQKVFNRNSILRLGGSRGRKRY